MRGVLARGGLCLLALVVNSGVILEQQHAGERDDGCSDDEVGDAGLQAQRLVDGGNRALTGDARPFVGGSVDVFDIIEVVDVALAALEW